MNISILSLCQAHSIYIFWAKVTLWLLFFFLHIQKPLKGMKFFSIKSFQKKKNAMGSTMPIRQWNWSQSVEDQFYTFVHVCYFTFCYTKNWVTQ